MKPVTIKDREARTDEGRERLLTAVREAATAEVNGELQKVQSRIHSFEKRYGMNSDTMVERVGAGSLPEDEEVCAWFMALMVRKHLVERQQARPN